MAQKQMKISVVDSNAEKANTYRQIKVLYKRAVSAKFYYEAIAIDYAMIEDRMRSFLYHIGALTERTSLKLDQKQTKRFLIGLYNDRFHKKAAGLNVNNIKTKRDLITAVLDWASSVQSPSEKYQSGLKAACEKLDISDVMSCFAKLDEWCEYRNEIIHGLMNKKTESLSLCLSQKADEGMKLANRIDAYVDAVSKGHTVRKSIKLKTE